jgi:hypothetical protein
MGAKSTSTSSPSRLLEAEPLDHLDHFALVVLVLLAAAAGLRQAFLDLLCGRLFLLAPRRQIRGVTDGVAAQVTDRDAQTLDQHIKDFF